MTFRSEPLLQITNIRKDGVTSIIKGRNAVYIQKKISYILKNSCFLDEEKTEKIFFDEDGRFVTRQNYSAFMFIVYKEENKEENYEFAHCLDGKIVILKDDSVRFFYANQKNILLLLSEIECFEQK